MRINQFNAIVHAKHSPFSKIPEFKTKCFSFFRGYFLSQEIITKNESAILCLNSNKKQT